MAKVNVAKLADGKQFQEKLEALMSAATETLKAIPESFNEETQFVLFLAVTDIGTRIAAMLEGVAQATALADATLEAEATAANPLSIN